MLAVSLLGSFQITQAEQVVTDFRYDKVRALLAYLMVEQQLTHHRDFLTSLLWPEQNEKKARHSLRQALSTLRRALGDDEGESPTLIANRSTVQVNPESKTQLDVQEFEELLKECGRHSHADAKTCADCMERRRQAMKIYQGDFLKSIVVEACPEFENWIWWKREKLSRLAMDALVHLTQYHERRDELELARHYAQCQLDLESWREETHRHLMVILTRSGERSAALVQYETCRRILKSELDVEPDEETQQLYQKIRQTPAGHRGNFPTYPTPLVNRYEELAEISLMLTEPNRRLITLVGPSGIGKTRLSLQIAKNKQHTFLDGTYFVRLETLHHASEAWAAIADTVGFTEVYHSKNNQYSQSRNSQSRDSQSRNSQSKDSQSSTVQNSRVFIKQLIEYLSQREMLLILDNFEQVENGDEVIAKILQDAANVKLIVTSRIRLNSPWESVVELEGLEVPPTIYDLEDIERYSAIRLFIQSAEGVQRNFALSNLSEDDKFAMVEICRMVGGMPLAIELAASWLRVSSCRQILEELKHDLAFLRTESIYYPKRHRNIWQLYQATWEVLSEGEQGLLKAFVQAFRRASFTLEEAHKLSIGASFHNIAQLVDKCLIRCNQDGQYTIYELFCCYILDKMGMEFATDTPNHSGMAARVDNKRRVHDLSTPSEQTTDEQKQVISWPSHSAKIKHLGNDLISATA